MVVKNQRKARAETSAHHHNWPDAIGFFLSKISEIDAVFLLRDDAKVVHVFSVVREFRPNLYDKLLPKENAIEGKIPEITFEFHVRAHQGRDPAEAVPFDAELVFTR